AHRLEGRALELQPRDVQIGDWTSSPSSPTFQENEASGNAVRVSVPVSLPTAFAGLFGVRSLSLRTSAVAAVPLVHEPQPGGPCSLYAGWDMKIEGSSRVDAYDSRTGPYPGVGAVGASACSARQVLLQNRSTVVTDVSSIAGLTIQDDADFLGRGRTLEAPLPFPSVDWSAVRKSHTNARASCPACPGGDAFKGTGASEFVIDLGGNEVLTLPPGTFYFEKLVVTGKAEIRIPGPDRTRIYVRDELSASGRGFVNDLRDPRLLELHIGGEQVYLSGDAEFFGSVTAPTAKVDVTGKADFYGTILAGRDVVVGGSMGLHLDVALAPWGQSSTAVDRISGAALRLVQ
ncbi:MAG: TadG family pilus assembly protein, partial [Myxococcota bacterium]